MSKAQQKPKAATVKSKTDNGLMIARWRFYFVVLALLVVVGFMLTHLARLQVVPGEEKGFEFLQGQGDARTVRTESIAAYRGVITDRHGEPLAVSTPVVSLWANPQVLLQAPEVWSALAGELGKDKDALAEKLNRYRNKEFVYLRRHMPPQDAEKLLANDWPGVYGRTEYQRYYPAGEVAAHLVGFTDIDERGREGMELAFEDWLQGKSGAKQVVKDLKGRVIKDDGLLRAPQPGQDLMLSVDLRMQYLAYRELKAAVTRHKAKSGSVVVLDTESGDVLAVANQPAYNPNDRSRIRVDALRNRALTDQFEPGSTMKPLTVLAAMETKRYTPGTLIDTRPGYIRVGKKTLLDPINYGVIDVTRILTKSSQVGITKMALDMEPEHVRDIFFRLGFGQSTGTGFPGEGVGVLPNKSKWHPIERANFAFGHGLSVTTLQLAQAYNVLANRGEKQPLSLVRRAGAAFGEGLPAEQVVEPKLADQVVKMLTTVVGPDGTAKRARLDGYQVAGKTGTIHKVGAEGYAADRYIGVFAGMAPANDPKVVAVVVINEPTDGKYFGGEVAAPVFANVTQGVLRLMRVPPNEKLLNDKQKVTSTEVKTEAQKEIRETVETVSSTQSKRKPLT
ncbi:peptidoglycan D,D-transpeptidase FtsI [Maricurvus nonylphenolicus]